MLISINMDKVAIVLDFMQVHIFLTSGEQDKNVVIFGTDSSLSISADNINKDILMLGELLFGEY